MGIIPSALHILMKVYSLLSLTGNLENFIVTRRAMHSSPCIGIAMWHDFLFHTLPIRVWSIVYLLQGIPEPPVR